ncbi:MAG: M48 family metallopeptidase [Spirochaetaceae bacterium]|nr:M48 family metallopeptidase [Spirochaetaceae bacterium]
MIHLDTLHLPPVRLTPPAETRAELRIAGLTFPVIVSHERRRDARATIGRRGVLIRLPVGEPIAWCDRQVTSLLHWAARTIARDPGRFRIRPPRSYHHDQRLSVAGSEFRLHLEHADRATNAVRLGRVDMTGCRTLRLILAAGQSEAQRDHALPRLVSRGLALAKEPELRGQVEDLNDTYFRRPLGTVRYRYARSRWGSCSARGNISIATRLLLAPPDVFEYVLVHELAHLVELNHSSRFWNLVECVVPDFRTHQAWLRRHHQDCQI